MLLPSGIASGAHRCKPEFGPWVTRVGETEFTVLWKTGERMLCYVSVCPADEAFESCERPCFYETVAGRTVAGCYHSVRVTGLEPGKSYRYVIYGREVKEDEDPYAIAYGPEMLVADTRLVGKKKKGVNYQAATLSASAPLCRFSMVNDMHNNAKKYSSLFDGVKPSDMDFLCLCGDIVSYSQSVDTVTKYSFQPVREILGRTPVVFARGNHESRGRDFASVPYLFPSTTGQFYYSFRQGPVAFLVLDCGEDKPDSAPEYSGYAHFDDYRAQELEWLKAAVKDPSFTGAPFRVVLMHVPAFYVDGRKEKTWHSQRWITENFLPVLNDAGVDLMLSGHLHKYVFSEPGASGNRFPIIVNSNTDRLDFRADADAISIEIRNAKGEALHTHRIEKR